MENHNTEVRRAESRPLDATEVHQSLETILSAHEVVEVRAPGTRQGTMSGYFDDADALVGAVCSLDGRVSGVYHTVNPVNPDLLARAVNRLLPYAKHTTSDADITRRMWLPIDFDPKRPAGISSTDSEHHAAIERAIEAEQWLRKLGFPEGVVADSGNGAHLLQRIDLANNDGTKGLIQQVLKALALQFSDDVVEVDLTTFNAARIFKAYGSLSMKGDSTPSRPHRRSGILKVPEKIGIVAPGLLHNLADMAPKPRRPASSSRHKRRGGSFNLEDWLAKHNLPVVSQGPWADGAEKWILNPCPWNPDHTNRSAYVLRFANGAIAAGCHHNSCMGNDWRSLRALYDGSHAGPASSGQPRKGVARVG